jgi:hypothetical protein
MPKFSRNSLLELKRRTRAMPKYAQCWQVIVAACLMLAILFECHETT